jgi:hypothetical protein
LAVIEISMLLKGSLLEAAHIEFLEMKNVQEPLTYMEACSVDGHVAFIGRTFTEVCGYVATLTNLAIVERI